ncbi:MAG: hypothetical protein JWP66_1209, partial [Naasia sp.]|nr:hypothetical protein [Naasia sp.]
SGGKPPYGNRSESGGKPPYGNRGESGGKPPYGNRGGAVGHPPAGERRERPDRSAGEGRSPFGRSPAPGERRSSAPGGPRGDRPGRREAGERPSWTPRESGGRHTARPGAPRGDERAPSPHDYDGPDLRPVRARHDDPPVAEGVVPSDLDKAARIQLKTLTKENADWVATHLAMAARLLDTDPELAHQHALSAARKGGRIAVVRESLAITAYSVGDFALALRELRTFRRISGSNDQLALMVDSERGMGRPDRALELGRSVPRDSLPAMAQVALAIAMSGARLDLGQPEAALAELEIPQLDPDRAFSYSPPLYRAYAEVLDELGRADEAEQWRSRAEVAEDALDPEDDVIEIEDVSIDADADDDAEADASPNDEAPVDDAATDEAPVDEDGGDVPEGR